MRRLFTFFFSLCLVLCFTACSSKAQSSSDLKLLQNEEGLFIYPNLEWGMTVDEVASITGWTLPEPQKVYNEKGEHVDTVVTVQNILFVEQSWIAQLQFDPQGSLWNISLAQNGDAEPLEKIFKDFDAELTDLYGDPSQAVYDNTIQATNGTILDSTITWDVANDSGERVNSLTLSYRYIENRNMGSLALAMNHKK